VLQVPGALDVAIEFHSLSKSQHDRLAGWFCGGSAHAIKGLGQVKTNVDSGVFKAFKGQRSLLIPQEEELP